MIIRKKQKPLSETTDSTTDVLPPNRIDSLEALLPKVIKIREAQQLQREEEELKRKRLLVERSARWEEMYCDLKSFSQYTKELYGDDFVPVPYNATSLIPNGYEAQICLAPRTSISHEGVEDILVVGIWDDQHKRANKIVSKMNACFSSFYLVSLNQENDDPATIDITVASEDALCPSIYRPLTEIFGDLIDNWTERYRKETEHHIKCDMAEFISQNEKFLTERSTL